MATTRTTTKQARKPARKATNVARKTARKTTRKTTGAARKATGAARKATRTTKKVTRKATRKTTGVTRKTTAKATRKATKPSRPSSKRTTRSTMDAIAELKRDHRDVEQLFSRFEKAGDGALVTKRQLVDRMIEELSRHAEIEELVFYPAVRRDVDDADDDVLEALEEHHVVKVVLRELEDLDPGDERFDAKVKVMMENVRHHVKEEEHELFPEVRDAMGRRELLELGDELRAAKPRVPTRPHPAAPDEPPGNAIIGGAVAALDKARTVGKQAVTGRRR